MQLHVIIILHKGCAIYSCIDYTQVQ